MAGMRTAYRRELADLEVRLDHLDADLRGFLKQLRRDREIWIGEEMAIDKRIQKIEQALVEVAARRLELWAALELREASRSQRDGGAHGAAEVEEGAEAGMVGGSGSCGRGEAPLALSAV
jgi:DNA repair exonuclease SbcCD ATPase subunit